MKVRLSHATPHEEELIRRAADVGLDCVPVVAGLIDAIQRMDDEISRLSDKLENAKCELCEESEMGGAR